jgi:predicted LPLAT superfamily acyltransferase
VNLPLLPGLGRTGHGEARPGPAADWRQVPERGSTRALALIHWIATRIGRGTARLILYPISVYFLLTARGPRRASRQFLARIGARDCGWWGSFRHILTFAATILDRIFFIDGDIGRFHIRIHNGEIILDQMASGRGCVLLGSHLGSFEALRAVGIGGCGLKLKVLMNLDHNAAIARFVNRLNPAMAETIIPIRGSQTLIEAAEYLDKGYVIGMLGDRVVDDSSVVPCTFLAGRARFPAGPFVFASAACCPIILAFALYRGGNRYDVHFEVLAERVPPGLRRRPEALADLVQAYADRLQHYARLEPDNWFNFFDFWGGGGRDGA